MFTGLYPSRNGATAMEGSMGEDVVHLAQWLRERGFQTAGIVNANFFTRDGLERGFDTLDWIQYVQGEREGSPVADSAIRWLRERDPGRPFFAFVHFMDVHSDYASLPEYESLFVEPYQGSFDGTTQQLNRLARGEITADDRDVEHLLRLYDAGIRQVDAQLGRLFDYLERDGLLEDTLIVVTSDHGEEFLEHGSVIHGKTQYQEVIRIPLVVRGPGVPEGRRVGDPVSLIDIVPTCLGLLSIETPADLDGLPLQGLWEEPRRPLAPRLLYFEADVTFPPPGPGLAPVGPRRAVRFGRFKLHYHLQQERGWLFDLVNDPGELRSAHDDHSEVTALLLRRLSAFVAGRPLDSRLSAADLAVLNSPFDDSADHGAHTER